MNTYSKFHRSLGILIATSLFAGGFAAAQEAQEGKPDRMLRLLALGDPPPWEEINTGERRVQKDPPPGSVPPDEVVQMTSEGDEQGDPVRLRLGQLSTGLAVGPTVRLYDSEEIGAGAEPWLKFAMPSGKKNALAVVWRDFREKKWSKVGHVVLPEDLTSFPPGSIRFVNVSPYNAEFSVSGQVVKLGPGKHATSRPRAAFKKLPLLVHIASKSGAKMKIADEEINQSARERTTIFIFFADGEKQRTPAKAKVILENTAAVPKLPSPRNR